MQSRLFILISLISLISITGLYAYAVTLDVTILSEVEDDATRELNGPMDAAITTIAGKTYVVVSGGKDSDGNTWTSGEYFGNSWIEKGSA